MLMKAIIESNNIDNQYKIRIPKYHKLRGVAEASSYDQLPFASVCYLPGIFPNYSIGDIVYIDFENDDLSYPVILGKLLSDNNKSEKSVSDIESRSLKVQVDTTLSEDTKIGQISYNDFKQAVQSVII